MTTGIAVGAALVIAGTLFWMTPVLSRPGLFFGVTVPSGFAVGQDARRLLGRYRTSVVISTLVLMLIAALLPGRPVVAVVLAVQSAAALGAWLVAHRSVRALVPLVAEVRAASLVARDDRIPGGTAALVGPFIIVALAAFLVAANWNDVPETLPSFRRGSRESVEKSVASVFGPFAFVAALLVAFTLQTVLLVRRTRQIAVAGPSFEAEVRFKRRTAQHSLVASYLMAAGPSWFAVNRALGRGSASTGSGSVELLWLAAVLASAVGVTVWMIRSGQGGQRSVPDAAAPAGDRTPDAAWPGGLFYFNPADPSVFVERRMGVGWSPNFGNPWAWLVMGCGIGLPLLVVLLMR